MINDVGYTLVLVFALSSLYIAFPLLFRVLMSGYRYPIPAPPPPPCGVLMTADESLSWEIGWLGAKCKLRILAGLLQVPALLSLIFCVTSE
jgi:hypothetical protein